MENYEQRYKEALERAKCMHEQGMMPERLEYVFPELKESEDERIRKKVIDVLKLNVRDAESQMQARKGVDRTFEVYACNKVIAWLEKQGDFNTYDYERVNLDSFVSEIQEFSDMLEDKPKPYWDGWYEAMEWVRINGCPFEKQGEQKSEEVNNLHNYLYDGQKPADEVGNYDHKKVLQTIINEQKPAEWSEEEKVRIDRIINVLDWAEGKGRISYSDWEDYVTYVKSLKPQNNQKPTWSEEDEEMRIYACKFLDDAKQVDYSVSHKEDIDKCISWLKSIKERCTWKPTKEQMKALSDSIPENVKEISAREMTLNSLYQDLQKLQ